MRVGLVCPYAWDSPGGVKAHVDDLGEQLRRMGHEVAVLAPAESEEDLPAYVTSSGKPVAVAYNGSVARLSFGPRATARIRRWIRDGDFDVMHVHEPVAPSIGAVAIWAARGPIVATWHSSMERSRVLAAGFYLAQTVMEKVTARIAVSEYARRTLVDHLGGDAVLIPNGVDVSAFAAAAPLPGRARGERTMLFLGRIDEPRKGLPTLLEALPAIAARVPDVQLLVAGPGDVDAVRSSLPKPMRDRVEFLGLVSERDKVAALHSVDLYVAPNTGGESFGIVLLEAMSAGTAVLASDLDAFRRVLDGGRAGVLFPIEDADGLAHAATDLLLDPAARDPLVTAGHAVAARYDWVRVAKDIVNVYESVTVSGERVREDLRGQVVGRLARPRAWGAGR